MKALFSQIALNLSEWLLAILVLVITIVVTTSAQTLLKKLHKDRGWKILRQMAPSISNIFYVLGLKIFSDVAPLHPKVQTWLDHSIYILAVIIFLGLVQKAATVAIEWSAFKANSSNTLQQGFIPLMRNIITLFVFFSGAIMVLRHFNYDVMSLITALGVSSLAVGLAAKDTLSNMISGFILIIDRNFLPGHRINIGGSIGDVEEIGLRSTRIKLSDGNVLIAPNSDLVNSKIVNLSMPSREVTCSSSIRAPYSSSFAQIKANCLIILNQIDRVSKNKPISINLISLADGNQLIQIGFWVLDTNDVNSALSEFNEKILSRLRQEGIELIPSPILPTFTR